MRISRRPVPYVAILLFLLGAPAHADDWRAPLVPVDFTHVKFADTFWAPRIQTTVTHTLERNLEQCESTGRLRNFDLAAACIHADAAGEPRPADAKYEGYFFNDSDVYKVLEGASFALFHRRDADLDRRVDAIITRIAAAQQPDGYLNAYFTLDTREGHWTNTKDKHELYCAGHLIEAAVAHFQMTGKRNLLDIAVKVADHICATFGPGKNPNPSGHEEIELALVKLSDLFRSGQSSPACGNQYIQTFEELKPDEGRAERYLAMARFFVNQRGNAQGRKLYGEYAQDQIPVRDQAEVVGHAVRAMYLYSGVTDLAARLTNTGYEPALDRVWTDLTERKLYVTGGIGPSANNEGFTVAYDLPNDTAYAETCAAIGLVLWSGRMGLLKHDARYYDVLERALYNGVLSGISLSGEEFFYVNPLASRGNDRRQPWFGCACCPPNLLRLLASVGGFFYSTSDNEIYVNLYAAGKARVVPKKLGEVTITQETRYPWDGRVKITAAPHLSPTVTLNLRIPGWCTTPPKVLVSGKELKDPVIERGYLRVTLDAGPEKWVELDFRMPVQRILANPKVKSNIGRVALQRGPLLYCLEDADHPESVRTLAIPRESKLQAEYFSDVLGGVSLVTGISFVQEPASWKGRLYQAAPATRLVDFTAVPYYAWANRKSGNMVVWVPESVTQADAPLPRGVTASASFCSADGSTTALLDGLEPASSDDHSIPRLAWWPHKGDVQWVQYDFDSPRRISSSDVYWFSDEKQHGECRVPAAWRLLVRDGEEWKPVKNPTEYGVHANEFNHVTFEPVTTNAVRLEATLPEKMSSGILEWRVEGD